ncbi:Serine/threonine protein kinase [Handroanthus impetiginosus]|uniref:Serine/threonine protein kinase n=1 Tax=Handroanthus impetiginosus TaxID=429701 RepID=A0A2G9FZZ6_9LAMI|nr:Serine/threonine protein kinase [Handroanthus impetiginosus]
MMSIWFLMCLWFSLSCSHQYYDQTLCSSEQNYPGTRYTCSASRNSCETYFIYRANDQFTTISRISNLFNTDPDILLSINKNVTTSTRVLDPGHEVLVPIKCSCTNQNFFQANFTYKVTQNTTLSEISCGILEGLVKAITLAEENLLQENDVLVHAGSVLLVPLKCACPDEDIKVKYLVTYPFIKGDDTEQVSEKFNVSAEEIWEFNHLDPLVPTVYPNTTILIPLKDKPLINFNIPNSDPPTPMFLPTTPVEKSPKMSQFEKLVIGISMVVAFLSACGLYIKALKKFKHGKFNSSTHRISSLNSCSTSRISTNSCLSPDLLLGIKYSLDKYTLEDIKRATKNFSENLKISDGFYKGLIDKSEVMIKTMGLEETRKVIDVHSRINHVNILKLNGVCYGEDDFLMSYLVFEFPSNDSLRDCLASSSSALHWFKRTQIAFDIATGLHYLNYSVIPAAYNHLSISCKNVFLTSTWREKIAIFGIEKVDVFAFGVVLIELITGKEVVDEEVLRDTMKFLVGGNEGGCFDKLRKFVDPCLKDDYPIAEALCLVVLAGSCVEEDPLRRPSMDDVLKILARMV